MDRLERTHASQRLLDMTHPHGDVPPVQNVMDVASSCPANQFRQRRLAVADHRDRPLAGPALLRQRRPDLRQRPIGGKRRQGKPPRLAPWRLDLSDGDVEVAGLMPRRGSDVRPVDQHRDVVARPVARLESYPTTASPY